MSQGIAAITGFLLLFFAKYYYRYLKKFLTRRPSLHRLTSSTSFYFGKRFFLFSIGTTSILAPRLHSLLRENICFFIFNFCRISKISKTQQQDSFPLRVAIQLPIMSMFEKRNAHLKNLYCFVLFLIANFDINQLSILFFVPIIIVHIQMEGGRV